MIENGFVHQSAFEYEYEYRSPEYEYDEDRNALLPERWRSVGGNGASDLDVMEKSERHFRVVASLGSSDLSTRTPHTDFRIWNRNALATFLHVPAAFYESSRIQSICSPIAR